ncbi:MAG: phospholipase [Planctomycetota bacterium]
MSLDYALLHTLHLKLKARKDLNERIRKGPLRIKAAGAALVKFQQVFDDAKAAFTKGRLAADQKELQLSEREAKIEDLKAKLNACKSNKEFSLLKDQIAADEQANAVLSDEILEQLERNDQLEADVQAAQTNLDKARSENQKVSEKIKSEIVVVESELEVVEIEITAAEARLPADISVEYRRLVEAKQEDALSETDLETCGNCYRQLTAQLKTEISLRRAVFCPGCGALMYMTAVPAR